MRSAFFGLNVATSALHTSRANLHINAHNIANIQTRGFSRQVANQMASSPLRVAGTGGMMGTGSQITGIIQMRNPFLDAKFRNQHSILGQFATKSEMLAITQGILREGVNVGLTSEVNSLFGRIQDSTTNAGDLTFRRNLLSSFESMSVFLNSTFSQLRTQQEDANQEISTIVGRMNSIGRQIQSLNNQISLMETNGTVANDLRDQRNLLIDELSGFVNITVNEVETNPDFAAGRTTNPRDSRLQMQILIDGMPFVSHLNLNEMQLRQRDHIDNATRTVIRRNPEDASGLFDIFWANGSPFDMYSPTLSGQLRGLIDLRDGNGGNFGSFVPSSPAFAAGPPPTVTLDFEAISRLDLPRNGGVLTVRGASTTHNIRYSNFVLDNSTNPPTATFTLIQDDQPSNITFAQIFAQPNIRAITVGQTNSYSGIPAFMARLNEMARALTRAFNEGVLLNGSPIVGPGGTHVTGHLNGVDLAGNSGNTLISYRYINANGEWAFNNWDGTGDFDIFNITADNFVINPEILSNPDLLALASDINSLPSGNQVLHSWLAINQNRSLFREGTLLDFMAAMTGEIGIIGRQAENFEISSTELLVTIDNQREAFSGVNLDEETASIIMHQLVFQAASRLVSIIDNLYDVTINRMGSW